MAKIYVIVNGRNPDTGERNVVPERFNSWGEAQKWVNGVENAKFKGFPDSADREEQIAQWVRKVYKQLSNVPGMSIEDMKDPEDSITPLMEEAHNTIKEAQNMVEWEYNRMLHEANIQEQGHLMRMMPQFEEHCDNLGITSKEMAEVLQVMFCNIMDYIIGRRGSNDNVMPEDDYDEPLPFN